MIVHFPAALLPTALLLFALAWWRRSDGLFAATRACVTVGAAGALAAPASGWRAHTTIAHGGALHGMIETHKYAALVLLALSAAAAVWCWRRPIEQKGPAAVFTALLVTANALLVSVGDLGARMVYREGAGVDPQRTPAAGDGGDTGHHHGDSQGNHH